jgi:hypothetical protein
LSLQVDFHNSKCEFVCQESVRLPKDGTVADLLSLVAQQLAPVPTRPLRLLEVCYNRIYKVFKSDDLIADINDQYWTLRVEEVPMEDELLGPGDRIINVHHFKLDATSHSPQVVRSRSHPTHARHRSLGGGVQRMYGPFAALSSGISGGVVPHRSYAPAPAHLTVTSARTWRRCSSRESMRKRHPAVPYRVRNKNPPVVHFQHSLPTGDGGATAGGAAGHHRQHHADAGAGSDAAVRRPAVHQGKSSLGDAKNSLGD